jgi:hypothetical protein
VVGKFVESRRFTGAFDMPMALSKGRVGGNFYRDVCMRMFADLITLATCIIFREFLAEQEVQRGNNLAPGSKDQTEDHLKPLHEHIHKDDLRLEATIRVIGRNITVVEQNGNFTMPGALMPALRKDYEYGFKGHFQTLVIGPAEAILIEFFQARLTASNKEADQTANKTFIDKQDWNFGSEELTRALEQEQPAKREAA